MTSPHKLNRKTHKNKKNMFWYGSMTSFELYFWKLLLKLFEFFLKVNFLRISKFLFNINKNDEVWQLKPNLHSLKKYNLFKDKAYFIGYLISI
jgi:hypothetical protein